MIEMEKKEWNKSESKEKKLSDSLLRQWFSVVPYVCRHLAETLSRCSEMTFRRKVVGDFFFLKCSQTEADREEEKNRRRKTSVKVGTQKNCQLNRNRTRNEQNISIKRSDERVLRCFVAAKCFQVAFYPSKVQQTVYVTNGVAKNGYRLATWTITNFQDKTKQRFVFQNRQDWAKKKCVLLRQF